MAWTDHDYHSIAEDYIIQTIKSLHYFHDCVLAFKIKNKLMDTPVLNESFKNRNLPYSLREPREIAEGVSSTNYTFFSTLNRLKRYWNVIPLDIKTETSLNRYKQRLCTFTTSFS